MTQPIATDPLFVQIASGDKKAFNAFFARYYPRLIRFANTLVHDEQQAEDVVADVLTTLLTQRQRVFRLPHFEAYLYTAVKNKALSSLRNQARTTRLSQDNQRYKYASTTPTDPHTLLVDQEFQALINRLIQNLPPKRQMVFQLLREEGMSYRQVAGLMEISERTVEVHLRLAIKTLRQGIEDCMQQQDEKSTRLHQAKVWLSMLVSLGAGHPSFPFL